MLDGVVKIFIDLSIIDWQLQDDNLTHTVRSREQEKVPVKQALAKSYGVFNKLFTASPTMSWPNHMFTQSGTSCGNMLHPLFNRLRHPFILTNASYRCSQHHDMF